MNFHGSQVSESHQDPDIFPAPHFHPSVLTHHLLCYHPPPAPAPRTSEMQPECGKDSTSLPTRRQPQERVGEGEKGLIGGLISASIFLKLLERRTRVLVQSGTNTKTCPDTAILAVAVFCGKQLPGSDLKLSLPWVPWDESLSGDTGREGEGDRMQRQQRWT